jgi:hypothetical protein
MEARVDAKEDNLQLLRLGTMEEYIYGKAGPDVSMSQHHIDFQVADKL